MRHYSLYAHRRSKFSRLGQTVIPLAALSLIATGVSLLWPWVSPQVTPGKPPDPTVTITNSTDHPDERTIKVLPDEYKVAANQPRVLRLPSVNMSAYVQKVGVDQDERVAVPNNVSLAGWYTKSVAPGDPGLSIIDGHVAGRYKAGVFGQLYKLHVGDRIVVEYGDTSQKQFNVTKMQTVPEAEAAAILFAKQPDIPAQLNLITCASYIAHTKTYADRLIVTTKLISDPAP